MVSKSCIQFLYQQYISRHKLPPFQLQYYLQILNLNQQYLYATCFPFEQMTIAKRLPEPYSHLAITHSGVIFDLTALKFKVHSEQCVVIEPISLIPIKRTPNNKKNYVTLFTKCGNISKTIPLNKLLLSSFFKHGKEYKDIDIVYTDTNTLNDHIFNLVV